MNPPQQRSVAGHNPPKNHPQNPEEVYKQDELCQHFEESHSPSDLPSLRQNAATFHCTRERASDNAAKARFTAARSNPSGSKPPPTHSSIAEYSLIPMQASGASLQDT